MLEYLFNQETVLNTRNTFDFRLRRGMVYWSWNQFQVFFLSQRYPSSNSSFYDETKLLSHTRRYFYNISICSYYFGCYIKSSTQNELSCEHVNIALKSVTLKMYCHFHCIPLYFYIVTIMIKRLCSTRYACSLMYVIELHPFCSACALTLFTHWSHKLKISIVHKKKKQKETMHSILISSWPFSIPHAAK